jgi:hypothetical protein
VSGVVQSEAYLDGLADGAVWDLDGYAEDEDERCYDSALAARALRDHEGWDTATINAMGIEHCLRQWRVAVHGGRAWARACEDYQSGVRESLRERADGRL